MSAYIWDIARSYAELVDVVKLKPWTNVAFEKEWQNKHYSPDAAESAWAERPTVNIGAIAWPHYWVLDLDGPAAIEFFEQLCRTNGETRPIDELTVTIRTPGRGGGLHLWWRAIDLAPGQAMAQHLPGCPEAEIKFGPSRYTAVPPSERPEGRYEFAEVVREPQTTPLWLADRASRRSRKTRLIDPVASASAMTSLAAGEGEWAEAARTLIAGTVARALHDVTSAREGTRNRTVYIAAHRICEVGAGEHLTHLVDAAERAGLDRTEAEQTVASAAATYQEGAA